MNATIRQELRHARKAWPGTLVDPCLLSGYNYNSSSHRLFSTGFPLHMRLLQFPHLSAASPSFTCLVRKLVQAFSHFYSYKFPISAFAC